MKKIFIAIIITTFLSGCITYNSFVKTLDQNPGASSAQISQQLKAKPLRTVSVAPNTIYQVYDDPLGDTYLMVYFVNDKVAYYGQDTAYNHLEAQRKLGVLTEDEYRWRYERLQEEDIAKRQMAVQTFGIIQAAKAVENSNKQAPPQIVGMDMTPNPDGGAIYTPKRKATYDIRDTSGNIVGTARER